MVVAQATATPSRTRTRTATPSATATGTPPAPFALFSSYLGGNDDDFIRDVVTDAAGNIYLTGGTASSDFPTTAGAYDRSHNGWMDVFVTKRSPSGAVIWSTLLGGPNYDRAYAIELDPQGNIVIGGRAGPGFPTTAGVAQPSFGGDANPLSLYGSQDGFIAKLSADGKNLLWSTYFGGDDHSALRDLAVDSSGAVYVAETGVSTPSPHITANAFQTILTAGDGGVIAKLSPSGALVWGTYLHGTANDLGTPSIRVDASFNVYVLSDSSATDSPTTPNAYAPTSSGGGDLHLAKLSPDGRTLLYGTYLGGSAVEFTETHGLAIDPQGRAIVAATTRSADFPTTTGAFQRTYGGNGTAGTGAGTNYVGDGFVAIVSANGQQLVAATYIGGNFGEGIEGVSLDSQGRVYVSGATFSTTFPTTVTAQQVTLRGSSDFFVAAFSPNLSQLLYASYLGGTGTDFARSSTLSPAGRMIVVGHTSSSNWPTIQATQSARGAPDDGALGIFSPLP